MDFPWPGECGYTTRMVEVTQEKALIFRITHIENVPWILDHGLHCRNSRTADPNFREIGNQDLIAKRANRVVTITPGGTLGDYVPFYFTPRTPMLYNIKTGWQGVKQTPMSDIAVIVPSLHTLREQDIPFLFTDRHAYIRAAQFSDDLDDLGIVDWPLIASGNFKRSIDDLGRCERYQAEALVHREMPIAAVLGIAVYGPNEVAKLGREVERRSLELRVVHRTDWYF